MIKEQEEKVKNVTPEGTPTTRYVPSPLQTSMSILSHFPVLQLKRNQNPLYHQEDFGSKGAKIREFFYVNIKFSYFTTSRNCFDTLMANTRQAICHDNL